MENKLLKKSLMKSPIGKRLLGETSNNESEKVGCGALSDMLSDTSAHMYMCTRGPDRELSFKCPHTYSAECLAYAIIIIITNTNPRIQTY